MDIDLTSPAGVTDWQQDRCPRHEDAGVSEHRCAVKHVSICPCFRGIEPLDTVLSS
jgi:hypothetical protein